MKSSVSLPAPDDAVAVPRFGNESKLKPEKSLATISALSACIDESKRACHPALSLTTVPSSPPPGPAT